MKTVEEIMGDVANAIELQGGRIKEIESQRALNTASAKQTIDGLLEQLELQQKSITEMRGAMDAMLANENAIPVNGGVTLAARHRLGHVLFESPLYQEEVIAKRGRNCSAVKVEGGFFRTRGATLTSAAGSGGAVVDHSSMRLPGITSQPTQPLTLRDIIPVRRTTSGSIEYVRETGFYNLWTTLTAQAAAAQADILVANGAGFYSGQVITVDVEGVGTTEANLIISTVVFDIVDEEARAAAQDWGATITLTANLVNIQAINISVSSPRFNFTPEANLKPCAKATYAVAVENVKTIAHWIPASRQVLEDGNDLQDHVEGKLIDGLKNSEERQILYGDGSSTQLSGITTDADINTYVAGTVSATETDADAISWGLNAVTTSFYEADYIVMHPTTWNAIRISKGDDGHYLFQDFPHMTPNPMLWQKPVITTTEVALTTAICGAFGKGGALYDREDANVRISDQHGEYFTQNMVAILAEERLAQVIERPAAYCLVTNLSI